MIRRGDHPAIVAPPPVILLVCILLGWSMGRVLPDLAAWGRPVRLVGAGLVVLGVLMSGWSLVEFVRHRTHPDPYHPTKRIIQRGPYRISRNPIYVAFLLIHVGFGIWRVDVWIIGTAILTATLLQIGVINPEERYLHRRFGAEYDDYCRRVRRWI